MTTNKSRSGLLHDIAKAWSVAQSARSIPRFGTVAEMMAVVQPPKSAYENSAKGNAKLVAILRWVETLNRCPICWQHFDDCAYFRSLEEY